MNKTEKPKGRGLEAILGNVNISSVQPSAHSGGNSYIKIDSIDANPFQPRTQFDEEALEGLAQSIKTYGLIQPVTVRPSEGGRYQLISGERRYRAAKMAGLTEIPAFVRAVDDMQSVQMALVENIQRADLNPIDVAMSYQMLVEECHLTQEELSEKLGKDRSTISNYLRLLRLSTPAQVAVRDGVISMGHALPLVVLEDAALQQKVIKKVVDENLSVRQTEMEVKKLRNELEPAKPKVKITLSDEVRAFQTAFAKKLKAKVKIKKDITGKGSITIPFSSDEELKKIIDQLQ
ncbi:MAG: ParB/RepB/Spo0J family partition protein [Bacteroidales bacterium]|nr:ParB/RepB/Spo0J family partition protein [Bacteroidales bacterium]MBO7647668.1 ParB/RepB/Spo0J family partition protein [Bacteroidales bacterium]